MKNWTEHGQIIPPGYVEDFRIVRREGVNTDYRAYYVAGHSFQDMRLRQADADGPIGPLSNIRPVPGGGFARTHTRLYSGGLVDERRRIITAVWPGLPRAGLWLFTDEDFGIVKELLVAPQPGTGYSVAAANPAVVRLGPGRYEIMFEGRNEVVHWHVFRAFWDGEGVPVVDPEPLIPDAANPSLVIHGDRLFLYYSKHAGGLFETRAMSWPL